MSKTAKFAMFATVVLASAMTGAYQYGRHLVIKKQYDLDDDIFDLAREVFKDHANR